MRKALFEVAAAVAAAAIGLAVLKISDELDPLPKWILVIGTALVAFALASWAGRSIGRTKSPSGVEVGKRIRSGGSVTINDIDLNTAGTAGASVGNDVRSKKSTRISGVRIGRGSSRK